MLLLALEVGVALQMMMEPLREVSALELASVVSQPQKG